MTDGNDGRRTATPSEIGNGGRRTATPSEIGNGSTLFSGAAAPIETLGDHTGKAVARALRNNGVEVVFTLCGGHILPILDGCLDSGIRVIDARHEQAAVMMAAGYAYASRRPGVAIVTAGPGFTNAVTGMADANHSGVPVLVLAGRTPLHARDRGAIQDIDQLSIARVVSKEASACTSPERVEEYVTDALRHASAPRAGVTYVEFPTDVLIAPAVGQHVTGSPNARDEPYAPPESIAKVVQLLSSAERPVVVCGSGPFWGGADGALARFCETTNIPVTTTGPSRGLLPDSHPGCLGGLVHGGVCVALADVVVVCGSRFDGNLLFGGPPLFQPSQKIVQVDIRVEAFGGNRVPDLVVHGDAARVLDQIAAAWSTPRHAAWLAEARAFADSSRGSWTSESSAPVNGVHPGFLAGEVDAVAHERAGAARTLVADGGDILTWSIARFTAEHPGAILTTGTALGTLGVGIPFAIGAKVARPDDLVICLVGDGTLGLSAMEIETAARHDLPIVVVVSNNAAWADVQHEQRAGFGSDRLVASELGFTPYEKLAEMVGGHGSLVEEPEDVRSALHEAIDSGVTSVVNVRTDPTVISEILRAIGQLGVM